MTLDPDVEAMLRKEMREGGRSFEQALNEAVRRGLGGGAAPSTVRFRVEARPLRLRRGIDPAALQDIDDEIEIEEFQRKTRELERRHRASALELVKAGRASLAEGARLAGMPLVDFMELAGAAGLPVVDYAVDDLEQDAERAR